MNEEFHFWETIVPIFFLFNALGMIPAFVALLARFDQKKQIKIIVRETLIALFVLLAFTFYGARILKYFSISQSSIGVGGGLLLVLIGISMLFPKEKGAEKKELPEQKEPFIIPLAIPGLAGPGTMAALAVLADQSSPFIASGALILAWIPSFIILLASSYLKKLLGEKGLYAIEKLGGMLICFMGIEILSNGIINLVKTNFFIR